MKAHSLERSFSILTSTNSGKNILATYSPNDNIMINKVFKASAVTDLNLKLAQNERLMTIGTKPIKGFKDINMML